MISAKDLILARKIYGGGVVEDTDITLPELTNPATAEQILEGYEAIDGDGNKVTGTHVCESGGGGVIATTTFVVTASKSVSGNNCGSLGTSFYMENCPDCSMFFGRVINKYKPGSTPDTYNGIYVAVWGVSNASDYEYAWLINTTSSYIGWQNGYNFDVEVLFTA